MQSANLEQPLLAALDAKYEVLGAVGRDSDPAILLARERVTAGWVALRVIECGAGPDQFGADRLAAAIASAARLRHTQVARVYGVAAVASDAIAIATEYVPGRSVRTVLREATRLPPADVERVLRSAAAGLEYAHRAGVVHGTLGTKNIVVEDSTGRVVLTGFGETPAGAAPAPANQGGLGAEAPADQVSDAGSGAADDGEAGVAGDLLALGLVGWEMLTGTFPTDLEDPGAELSSQIVGGAGLKSRLPPDTPLRVVLALEGALQRNRSRRWSSAAAFLHQLSQDEALPESHRRHGRVVGVTIPRQVSGAWSAMRRDGIEIVDVSRVHSSMPRPPRVLMPTERRSMRVTMPSVRHWGTARAVALPAVLLGVGAIALMGHNPSVLRFIARHASPAAAAGRSPATSAGAPRAAVPAAPTPRAGAATKVGSVRDRPAVATARASDAAPPTAAAPLPRPAVPVPALAPPPAPPPVPRAAVPAAAVTVAERPAPSRGVAKPDAPDTAYAPGRIAAHGHTVRASDLLGFRVPTDARAAIDEYLIASRLDSTSATIHAGLAEAYAVVLQRGWYDTPEAVTRATDRGLAAADRALRLDPRSEPAWLARGTLLAFRNPRSLDDVFRSYLQAIKLVPDDAEGLRLYARAAEYTGDFDAADGAYRRALSNAPGDAAVLSDLAELAYLRRRFDEARRLAARAIAADPRIADAYVLDVRMRLHDGELRDAWSDAEMAERLGYPLPGAAASLLVYAQMPDTADTRARADSLVRDVRRRRTVLPVLDSRYLALALMAIGRREAAVDILELTYPRGAALWLALQDPGFQALHGHQRYERLVAASRAVAPKSD